MMKRFVYIFLISVLPVLGFAQNDRTQKSPIVEKGSGLKKSQADVESMRNDSQNKNEEIKDIFMFAMAFSHLDSVLYVTGIQKMENEQVNNGYFLANRDQYESALLDYMYDMGEYNRMVVLYFHEKEKRLANKKQRVLKRVKKHHSYSVGELLDFKF